MNGVYPLRIRILLPAFFLGISSLALYEASAARVGLILVCFGFCWGLDQALRTRVKGLAESTRRIAAGNLEARPTLSPGDDLAEVSEGIGRLASELGRQTIALRESESFSAAILHSLKENIAIIDMQGDIIVVNDAWMQFARDNDAPQWTEKGNANYLRICREASQRGDASATEALGGIESVLGGARSHFTLEYPCHSEHVKRWFLMSVSPLRTATGGAVIIHSDITLRKKAEAALQTNKARLGGIIESAMDAIISIDEQHRILLFNAAAEKMFGFSSTEMIGEPLSRLLPERVRAAHDDYIRQFGETGTTTRSMGALNAVSGLRRNGEEFPIEASISQILAGGEKLFTVIMRDITARRSLEQQFFRAQRMESLGALASGIAHDLNNVLSPITMGVQMLQMKHADEFSQKMLGVMAGNADRGAGMIKQILSFARGTGGQRLPLQTRHLIKEIIKLIRETFPKEITIQQDLGEDLWPVEGDPTRLHQVLMNLCVNARDAMPDGGTMVIRVNNTVIDEALAGTIPEAMTGNYLMISIRDSGPGIPGEIIDRIFEPFFTTKELDKGTGLGLATSHGIIKAHGGFITVESEIGNGADFRIYLPAQARMKVERNREARHKTPVGHGELILVVDDEASIREMTRSALEAFGYRVLTAADGLEAVDQIAAHINEVQLVLTDMMMPRMDGPTLIRTLRKMNPQLTILGSSGLCEEGKADEVRRLGVECILSKPYDADTLLNTVAIVIRGKE